MERYVFLFKRQQYEYLTKSVALASGALLLTSVATAVGLLFAKDAIEASVFSGTFAWLLFFVPALTVRYRHFICGRIPFRLFLPLTALTVSLPMVWIVAKAGLPLTLLALASAATLFFYTLRRGMQVNRTRSIISLFYLMFVCVGVCSLLEARRTYSAAADRRCMQPLSWRPLFSAKSTFTTCFGSEQDFRKEPLWKKRKLTKSSKKRP